MTRLLLPLLLVLLLVHHTTAGTLLQRLVVSVTTDETVETWLATHAEFGVFPSMDQTQEPALPLVMSHDLYCDDSSTTTVLRDKPFALAIPRGTCTFEHKVYRAQQSGAAAVLIYATAASRYSTNETVMVWPTDKQDYDCRRGEGSVDAEQLVLEPPYNAAVNDPVVHESCPCDYCLLTGNMSQQQQYQTCCAWDLPMYMGADHNFSQSIQIPAAFLTMAQGDALRQETNKNPVVSLYARWRPSWNGSALVIWMLGVAVCALAAYLTAGDYRAVTKKLVARQQQPPQTTTRSTSRSAPHAPPPDDILELTAAHAVAFVVMASTSLLVLFYFKIYNIVKVFYAFGCSSALSQVIIIPIVHTLLRRLQIRNRVIWDTQTEDIGVITLRELVAYSAGYSVGLVWLLVAFYAVQPESMPFFWITQDVFGACMCIMFMKVIRLNSIRVASILLIVAFFYDIFFVFLTPYFFKGKSVMITVATSGGPPAADDLWCTKYPHDSRCQGGNPLPMLLTIPRFFDFTGESSMLGLGDIVLPGLLISLAARLDAAKSLLGVMGGGSGRTVATCPEQRLLGCCYCTQGYFVPLVIAYAVGLLMANTAVYVMRMGQPALLYLVPCCLGTMLYVGWRRHEVDELWHGPKALRAADTALYGEDYVASMTGGHAPLPTEENDDVLAPPSAVDGEVAMAGRSGD